MLRSLAGDEKAHTQLLLASLEQPSILAPALLICAGSAEPPTTFGQGKMGTPEETSPVLRSPVPESLR